MLIFATCCFLDKIVQEFSYTNSLLSLPVARSPLQKKDVLLSVDATGTIGTEGGMCPGATRSDASHYSVFGGVLPRKAALHIMRTHVHRSYMGPVLQ